MFAYISDAYRSLVEASSRVNTGVGRDSEYSCAKMRKSEVYGLRSRGCFLQRMPSRICFEDILQNLSCGCE